jgi:hypothetical protein
MLSTPDMVEIRADGHGVGMSRTSMDPRGHFQRLTLPSIIEAGG